jgi:ornithine carbamoyltransferase
MSAAGFTRTQIRATTHRRAARAGETEEDAATAVAIAPQPRMPVQTGCTEGVSQLASCCLPYAYASTTVAAVHRKGSDRNGLQCQITRGRDAERERETVPRAMLSSLLRVEVGSRPIMVAVTDRLKGRSFTKVADWSRDELLEVLDLADELKRLQHARENHHLLPGRTLGMIFQKPSTRTRVSFEVGIYQLGGTGLYLSAGDLQLGRGETIKDTAVVLSRYLDGIMIRTFAQSDVEELAEHATIPVINGLTDTAHPCQALADVMTIRERFGRLEGLKVVYLGDGNNVCASLMVACAKLGPDFVAATPADYRPDEEAVRIAREAGGSVELTDDPRAAVEGADVLYTDVWTSMGQETEREQRLRDLTGYGIDAELLKRAGDEAVVLHCLPAHYGEEITEDLLYGPQSAVWDEAENRLHAQKALLALVIR